MTGSLGGELAVFRARKADGRGGRGKKVYGITERGEALFDELLAAESQSSEDDRVFNLRLAFARLSAARRPPGDARAPPGPAARAAGPAASPPAGGSGARGRICPQPDGA